MLKFLLGLGNALLVLLMWGGQTAPAQVVSNLSAWADLLGLKRLAVAISSPQVDRSVFWAALWLLMIMDGAALLWWAHKRRKPRKIASGQREEAAAVSVSAEEEPGAQGGQPSLPITLEAARLAGPAEMEHEDPEVSESSWPVRTPNAWTWGLILEATRPTTDLRLRAVGCSLQIDSNPFPLLLWSVPSIRTGEKARVAVVSAGETDFPDKPILHFRDQDGRRRCRSWPIGKLMYEEDAAPIRLELEVIWTEGGTERSQRLALLLAYEWHPEQASGDWALNTEEPAA